jgi:hypothetical protein
MEKRRADAMQTASNAVSGASLSGGFVHGGPGYAGRCDVRRRPGAGDGQDGGLRS